MDDKQYKMAQKKVEEELRNYPYYIISMDMSGLGGAVNPTVIINKNSSPSDPVSRQVVNEEYKKTIVNIIEFIYDKLDSDSKKLIDLYYYRTDFTKDEIMNEMNIDRNKFYTLKRNALKKFMIGFGYI